MRKIISTKVVRYIKAFTAYRLRIMTDSPKLGDDPEYDKLICKTINDFYASDRIDHHDSANQKKEEILDSLNSDDEIVECREIVRQIHQCPKCGIRQLDSTEQLHPTINKIPLYRLLRIFFTYRKKTRYEYKNLRTTYISPIKTDIRIFIKYLPLFSILCLFAGYLHIKIIYAHYEIETNYYFAIEDYLRSSFDQIVYAIVGVLYVGWRQMKYHVEFPADPRPVQERSQRAVKRWHTYILILAAIMLVLPFVVDDEIIERYARSRNLAVFVVLLFIIHYYVLPRIAVYFESLAPIYALFGSFIFLGMVTTNAFSERYRIDSKISDKTFEFEYRDLHYSTSAYTLIGLNSKYLFLLTEDNSVEIFPIDKIQRFKQSVSKN